MYLRSNFALLQNNQRGCTMKICVIVQNIYTLGGVQRVVSSILNRISATKQCFVTVLMPFDNVNINRSLFQLDADIRVASLDQFLKDHTKSFYRYLLAFNKRTRLLNNEVGYYIISNTLYRSEEKKELIQYCLENEFDAIIGTGMEYTILVSEIANSVRAKCIGWQHSTFDAYFERRGVQGYGLIGYAKKQYQLLDDVWVLTNKDKEKFDKMFGIDSKVLYNPVDNRSFQQNINPHTDIIFVGRLVIDHKGLDYLVRILRGIKNEIPDFSCRIIGDGRDKVWLINELKQAELQNNVEVVGSTDNVWQYYSDASVLIQTSRWEGFGMTILEAMMCGVPVVSFHNNGPDEIIREGMEGFLVDKFVLDDFVNKTISLIKDKKLRNRMGLNAMERAKAFSLDSSVSSFLSYLKD